MLGTSRLQLSSFVCCGLRCWWWCIWCWKHKFLFGMISKVLQTNAFVTFYKASNFPSLQAMLTAILSVAYRPVPSSNLCRTCRQFPCRKIPVFFRELKSFCLPPQFLMKLVSQAFTREVWHKLCLSSSWTMTEVNLLVWQALCTSCISFASFSEAADKEVTGLEGFFLLVKKPFWSILPKISTSFFPAISTCLHGSCLGQRCRLILQTLERIGMPHPAQSTRTWQRSAYLVKLNIPLLTKQGIKVSRILGILYLDNRLFQKVKVV